MVEKIAYKVLNAADWQTLQSGVFEGSAADLADGYIHLSTAAQLAGTIAKHFAGQLALTIAAIDLELLHKDIRWEVSRNGALFPHLYTAMRLSAVIAFGPVVFDSQGNIQLPEVAV
jgi:uncharacterized protein (DUF952 family)